MGDIVGAFMPTAGKPQGVSPQINRNVTYVTAVVGENDGRLTLSNLTLKTRLRHSQESPLELWEAREAITEAEKRGLIEARRAPGFVGHLLYGNEKLYHLKETPQQQHY